LAEITDIRSGPRGTRRRRVYVDGEEWRSVSAEVVRDIGLRVGQRVEPASLEASISEAEPGQAWNRVLRLLNYRERGSDELLKRLADDGFSPEAVQGAVSRAADLGFVDDRRFAESLVRQLIGGKKLGRRRVAAQLTAKGVAEDLTAELLERCCSSEEESARAARLASSLSARCGNQPERVARRLVTKGFDTGVAWRAARDACVRSDAPPDEE
jgi:regulatory protein